MNNSNRRLHIQNGGRVLIPQWRMRQIRWEESVLDARAKRAGENEACRLIHTNCHCGSLECLGAPYNLKL